MNDAAMTFAKEQEQLLRQQLADLYKGLGDTKDASIGQAEARKNELLAKIEAMRNPINQQYGADTRSAYVNKMMSGSGITDLLSRMGLNSSGFGVGQQLANETSYGQNLTNLTNTKNTNMQELTNKGLETEGAYNTEVAGIDTNYLNSKMQLDQYVNESGRKVYDNAYANFINEEQRKLENARAEQARIDSLKQQEFQNNLARDNYNLNTYNAYDNTPKPQKYTGTPMPYTLGVQGVLNGNKVVYTNQNGDTYSFDKGANPWTGQINKDVLTNGVFDPNKAFNGINGGYQPNTYQGTKLSKSGQTAPVNGQTQNVWKAGNKYVVWNGPANKYIEIIQKNGNWQVK